MSLYHLGTLMTLAYMAFLVVTILGSKFVFMPLIEDIFRDAEGWRLDVGLFLANLGWAIFVTGVAFNVYKYLFHFGV